MIVVMVMMMMMVGGMTRGSRWLRWCGGGSGDQGFKVDGDEDNM
jgi:hypothetical protein